ncbi:MAG: ROK family protein [Pyrinomonadaceae bacterium]
MKRINLRKANVARADTIRTINRQIVLNYVRERAPISRAEIAQETALQRSTISLIIDELKTEGMIEEIEGESTGGRPPILMRLRTAGAVAVGVDLGTERTIIATSDLAGRVLAQEEFATDPDARRTLAQVVNCIKKLVRQSEGDMEGIGVSLPGLVDFESGTALFIPYFNWRDWAVGSEIEAATGLPVTVDNDANAAALAELWFGRPEVRDVRDFIMVLVEEGIGTGIIIDGQVYRGEGGGAGEFGHMTIGEGAPIACKSGSRSCWEAFASEYAALAYYDQLVGGARTPSHPSFEQLIDRAFDGEAAAHGALLKTAYYLGVGIANLIKGLSPEAVVVGGSISRAWPLISRELLKSVAEHTTCHDLPSPNICVSSLGEKPQLMGALSFVLAQKFSSVSMT